MSLDRNAAAQGARRVGALTVKRWTMPGYRNGAGPHRASTLRGWALALVLLSALTPRMALGQTEAQGAASAPLPPDAQEAVKKGLIAAAQQDYPLAIQYFESGRKSAPDAPTLYYDLGVAESRISGHELRAIGWFGAYLAANPSAPNSAQIRDEIDHLEVNSRSNTLRLVKLATDQQTLTAVVNIVGSMSESNRNLANNFLGNAYIDLAYVYAHEGRFGLSVKALTAATAAGESAWGFLYNAEVEIAKAAAKQGDYADARTLIDMMPADEQCGHSPDRYSVGVDVVQNMLDHGDLADAQEEARGLKCAWAEGAKTDIAMAQLAGGDLSGAQGTLSSIAHPPALLEQQFASLKANPAEIERRKGHPLPWRNPPAPETPAQLIRTLFGSSDDDGHGWLNRRAVFDTAAYIRELPTAAPSSVVPFSPNNVDILPAGGPLEMFCALARAAREVTDAERVVDDEVGPIVSLTLQTPTAR